MRLFAKPHLMLILATTFLLAASPEGDSRTDHAKLQGAWSVVSIDGKPIKTPDIVDDFVFEKDKLRRGKDTRPFRLDESTKRMEIIRVGEYGFYTYALDGDDLEIEYTPAGPRSGKLPVSASRGPVIRLRRVTD